MKRYIKPLTDIINVEINSQLMAISGDASSVNSASIGSSDYDSENVEILSREDEDLWTE